MFSWNWADLIISFIGFLSAIGSAVFVGKIGKFVTTHKTVEKICDELSKEIGKEHYEECAQKIVNGDELNFKLVELPYIEGIRASDRMSLLADKDWFGDLIMLLHDVDEINKWASMSTVFFVSDSNISDKSNDKKISLSKRMNYAVLDLYKRLFVRMENLYYRIKQKER